MNLKELLIQVENGTLKAEEAYSLLKIPEKKELGYACLDTDRQRRTGFPEVVFCQGKEPKEAAVIFKELYEANGMVLGTRADKEHFEALKFLVPEASYHEKARCITIGGPKKHIGNIAICTGGTTDIPVAEEAALTASMCGANVTRFYDIGIAGLHRLLGKIDEIRKANVIIAVAGMEGALPSVIGGLVEQPVIAVPTSVGYGTNLEGVSTLLAMLNSCAPGLSIVNIDNGFGAGYTAAKINKLGGDS